MANPDQYKFESTGLNSPAYTAEAVTPSDVTNLTEDSRALYIGGTGSLSVVMSSGVSATFVGVPAGSLFPLRVRRVNSTGTTAASIVSLR